MAGYGVRSKFSERQQGRGVVVDVFAASPQLRRVPVPLSATAPLVVQNVSKYMTFTAPYACKLINAYVSFVTLPACAGGTSTLAIDRIAVDGSTATNIVAATTILTGYTAKIAVAQTLAATNPTSIAAGETIQVTVTTSNNAVGTADVGANVTMLLEPIEDTIITATDGNP